MLQSLSPILDQSYTMDVIDVPAPVNPVDPVPVAPVLPRLLLLAVPPSIVNNRPPAIAGDWMDNGGVSDTELYFPRSDGAAVG
jgi:hypothetical protein